MEPHDNSSIVGQGMASHILDGMGEGQGVLPSSGQNVHEDQDTAPDVA